MLKKNNLFALFLIFVCGMANAFDSSNLVLSVGVINIDNSRSSSGPQQNELGSSIATQTGLVPHSFSSPGTEQTVGDAVKLTLALTYKMTDHWAVTAVAGVPPKLEIYGSGSVTTPGLLNKVVPPVAMGKPANNPVASVLFWYPAVMVQYFFNEPHDTFRPFLGVGIGYSFFTHVRLHENFDHDLKKTGGYLTLASSLDPTDKSSAEATAAFRPLLNAGLNWNLDKRWLMTFSVSYASIKTDSIITIKDKNDKTVLTSTAKLDIPAVASSLTVGYAF